MSGPQAFVVLNDSVIVWDSYGDAGGTSVERWYPGWDIICSPWDTAFVWNNAGAIASAGAREGWRIICSPWDHIFVWEAFGAAPAGGAVPVVISVAHFGAQNVLSTSAEKQPAGWKG